MQSNELLLLKNRIPTIITNIEPKNKFPLRVKIKQNRHRFISINCMYPNIPNNIFDILLYFNGAKLKCRHGRSIKIFPIQ